MGRKVYTFNWALQSWVDGLDEDGLPTLESMARPNFANIVLATGDKETDEAFWSAVSQLKVIVEREYVSCQGDEDPLRWTDGGWHIDGDWPPERSFALMVGTEFVGLITAVASETGFPCDP